ncbi:hypothetical protein [Rhizobium sp. CECT 9324]|uniref:hypothetical protein n=1 Tax=Rhizobium sp. CECT 9324 TaxID=2845820 RepID=UPI001E2E26DE|nr:hypothetical protein [Rhizobium sp. CECT 9324]
MNAKIPPQNTKPAAAADNNSAESASTSHVMRIDRFTCPVVHLSVFTGRLAIIHRHLETLEGCLYSRVGVSMVKQERARRSDIFSAPCLTHQGPLLISTSLALTKSEC